MIKELPSRFTGGADVSGFEFERVYSDDTAYIYAVSQYDKTMFEVFERRNVAMCVDFEKRIYSETEFKEVYPKAKDFGDWAWCCHTLERAKNKVELIKQNQHERRKI